MRMMHRIGKRPLYRRRRRRRRRRRHPRPYPRFRWEQSCQLEALCRRRRLRGRGTTQRPGFLVRRRRLAQLVEPLLAELPLVLRVHLGRHGCGCLGVDVPVVAPPVGGSAAVAAAGWVWYRWCGRAGAGEVLDVAGAVAAEGEDEADDAEG
jgi:hypothetical protein